MNTTQSTHTHAHAISPEVATHRLTRLKNQLQTTEFTLGNEREWQELADHIEVHKYFINQSIGRTVTWDEAVFSWFENVYTPLSWIIDSWEVSGAFPDKTEGQLYLAISTHWHYLKERLPEITPADAAHDFASHYGSGLARWFSRFLQPSL
ncbi:MAG: hypothetical protein EA428_01560 [Spirochaetaceae bacterium]|nr:MAG: hypothetical protein EA428_01560 [Spirochaetaceae bacterium]